MTQLKHTPNVASATAISRSTSSTALVELLILGAGWTSTFLLPLLEEQNISHAATSRTGHDHTIPFVFDPESQDAAPYERLPPARTILITFPLKGESQSKLLSSLYMLNHKEVATNCRWIQLGSTGIFTGKTWNDSNSPYDKSNARAIAEDELLEILGKRACVLDLAGLYGGERQPRNWVIRIAKTKEDVKGKGAVHLVHGRDVARAIIGAHLHFDNVGGKRWIVNDLHVYDWWDLIHAWGKYAREKAIAAERMQKLEEKPLSEGDLQFERWVVELMAEEGVRALPRDTDTLGRILDGRGYWEAVEGAPKEGRVS
ncbi:hypothetical protein ACLMJK_004364 [Lecanora helva]